MLPGEPTIARKQGRLKRSSVSLLLAFLASAGVVFVALLYGDFDGYVDAVGSMRIFPFLGVAGLLIICNLLRICRLKILVPAVGFLPLARAGLIHQFMVAALPAKLGELALPVVLSRTGQVTGAEAVGVLLFVRTMDLAALLTVAGIALVAVGGAVDPRVPVWALGGLAAILAAGAGGFWVLRALYQGPPSNSRFGKLVHSVMAPAARLSVRGNIRVWLVTFVLWFALLLAFYLGTVSFGIGARFGEVVVSATVGNLIASLPVNGVAGVGVAQLGWAGALAAFGREFETAFVAGVAIQATALMVAGTGAAFFTGLNYMLRSTRRRVKVNRTAEDGNG